MFVCQISPLGDIWRQLIVDLILKHCFHPLSNVPNIPHNI